MSTFITVIYAQIKIKTFVEKAKMPPPPLPLPPSSPLDESYFVMYGNKIIFLQK